MSTCGRLGRLKRIERRAKDAVARRDQKGYRRHIKELRPLVEIVAKAAGVKAVDMLDCSLGLPFRLPRGVWSSLEGLTREEVAVLEEIGSHSYTLEERINSPWWRAFQGWEELLEEVLTPMGGVEVVMVGGGLAPFSSFIEEMLSPAYTMGPLSKELSLHLNPSRASSIGWARKRLALVGRTRADFLAFSLGRWAPKEVERLLSLTKTLLLVEPILPSITTMEDLHQLLEGRGDYRSYREAWEREGRAFPLLRAFRGQEEWLGMLKRLGAVEVLARDFLSAFLVRA